MILSDFLEDGWSVTISWTTANGQTLSTKFNQENHLPAIFRCTEQECTRTGFSLHQLVTSSLSRKNSHNWIRYRVDVECMGSILRDGRFEKACQKQYTVEVWGKCRTK